jgi:DivIVA domain-containing protein
MREGYDLDEVDDFVDRVIDSLDGRGAAMSPQEIEAEEFKVVRMREGYVMDDVDDWLDNAAAELRRLRKGPQGGQAPSQPQAVPHQQVHQPYDPGPPVHADYPTQAGGPPGYPPGGAAPAAGGYPAYQDSFQDASMHGTSHGTNHGTGAALDPLTDSAVHELDPALRALESGFPTAAAPAPPQQVPPPQSAPPAYPSAAPEPRPDESSAGTASTPATGLHHIEVWTTDLEVATKSFGWLFERLGWTLFQVWDNGRSWQAPGGGPYIVIERSPDLTWVAYDRKAPGLNHLALAVPERWMVDRIVSEAPAYGWRLMFADRHPYAGGPHHYAAYMENEEGFEVEVAAP